MSETKWTPASERWQLDLSDPEDGFDGFVIMRDAMLVSTFDGPQSDERQRQRALLCAAAPDMAEALSELLREFDKHDNVDDCGQDDGWVWIQSKSDAAKSDAVRRARAALAKARGETP